MKIERDVTGLTGMVCHVCFEMIGPSEITCVIEQDLEEPVMGAGWVLAKVFTHEQCLDSYLQRLVRARLTGTWSTQPEVPDGTFDIGVEKVWITKPP